MAVSQRISHMPSSQAPRRAYIATALLPVPLCGGIAVVQSLEHLLCIAMEQSRHHSRACMQLNQHAATCEPLQSMTGTILQTFWRIVYTVRIEVKARG